MGVAAPLHDLGGGASVQGAADRVGREIDFVLVGRVDHDTGRIVRALIEKAAVASDSPVLAAVVAPPEDSPVGGSGLDQRVDNVRVARGDG